MTHPSRQLCLSIKCPLAEAYRFTANPENLPKWAAGLSDATLKKSGEEWIANSPMGQVRVRFAKENSFGVIDHDVVLSSGEVNHNPFRLVKNGTGCEAIFTLFHLPGRTDEEFERDAAQVEMDLARLKRILEN